MTLQLRDLAQLFNSMDPSPFHERDLDADAEEFIVGWASELSSRRELELTIHLATPVPDARGAAVQDAVRHYFAQRAEMKQREFRHLMRRGRTSLGVGLLFLVGCLTASELLGTLGHSTLSSIAKEGLTIIGWVAMWLPLQIYLYDWWPLRDERRVLERLARMSVKVVTPAA
ncbi:MAG: hypothetical protein ABIQ12_06735 [Opitutaceae bacterium]